MKITKQNCINIIHNKKRAENLRSSKRLFFKSGEITGILTQSLSFENASHYLTATSFGERVNYLNIIRFSNGTEFMGNMSPQLIEQSIGIFNSRFKNNISVDSVSFNLVWKTNSSGFGDKVMRDESAFDFRSTEPVTRNFNNIINTSDNPVITILIFSSGIAGEVASGIAAPILVNISFGVIIAFPPKLRTTS